MAQSLYHYTAVPLHKDPTDIVSLCLFQLTTNNAIRTKGLNDTPNDPSQTQAEDDSFVCPLPQLTDF